MPSLFVQRLSFPFSKDRRLPRPCRSVWQRLTSHLDYDDNSLAVKLLLSRPVPVTVTQSLPVGLIVIEWRNQSGAERHRSMSRIPPEVPKPADPVLRRAPLPWERPKPAEEESQSKARLDAIMGHPAYREADRDVDVLHSDATRGVRLQLDHLSEMGRIDPEDAGLLWLAETAEAASTGIEQWRRANGSPLFDGEETGDPRGGPE